MLCVISHPNFSLCTIAKLSVLYRSRALCIARLTDKKSRKRSKQKPLECHLPPLQGPPARPATPVPRPHIPSAASYSFATPPPVRICSPHVPNSSAHNAPGCHSAASRLATCRDVHLYGKNQTENPTSFASSASATCHARAAASNAVRCKLLLCNPSASARICSLCVPKHSARNAPGRPSAASKSATCATYAFAAACHEFHAACRRAAAALARL